VPGAVLTIVRRPDIEPFDVIVLGAEKTTVKGLDLAIDRVLSERVATGIRPQATLQVRLPQSLRARKLSGSWRRWLTVCLKQLKESPEVEVEGFGTGRSVTLTLAAGVV